MGSVCWPSLVKSPPVPESTFQETSTTLEIPSTLSPTELQPSSARTTSPPPELCNSLPWSVSSSVPSCARSQEQALNSQGTSAMDTSTTDGKTLMKGPSFKSVPSSLTTAVPPCSESLDLWSTN